MSSSPNAKRSQMSPLGRSVRAYLAPIDRAAGLIAAFDPAAHGQFPLDSPPAPWLDLGWVENFQRASATKYDVMRTGLNGAMTLQYRGQPDAQLEFDLPSWGKLQMALAGGSQQMNVLAEVARTLPQGSGGEAIAASPLQSGSTAAQLVLTADQLPHFDLGDVVAVDADYTGQTGYLGAGAPGAYLSLPLDPALHVDFIRRITFNVSRVASKTDSSLLLAQPLLAAPTVPGMSVQRVMAFVDREGSSFFQEWSGLFIVAADSGGRACFYYPRLQVAASPREVRQDLSGPLFSHMLHASLHAFPAPDLNDGETVLCYRSYFPASTAAVY
jgi:hypothetical protein